MLPEKCLKRGAMIVIEGADRVGKSTHADKLIEALTRGGQKVKLMKFPDRTTPIGKMISSYLRGQETLDDHAVHLLFSANRWELLGDMKNTLHSGTTLIVDRYAYSGVAYSAAKPGLSLGWCKSPDIGLPRPDAVIYMTLPNDQLALRTGFGDEVYESLDFQEKVKVNYSKLIEDDWKIVSADGSIQTIHEHLLNIVKEVIDGVGMNPLDTLWTAASS